jgi:hypothetical protein
MKPYDALDRLFTEVDYLDRIVPEEREPDANETALALSVAKRVRSASTLVIKALAERRDQIATAQEGTST